MTKESIERALSTAEGNVSAAARSLGVPRGKFNRCQRYRRPETWRFGQFAVEPDRQRSGLGGKLMDFAETFAR